jgi:hypothetical protein
MHDDDGTPHTHETLIISPFFILCSLVASVYHHLVINLHQQGGSNALVTAAIWTGFVHLFLGILGTFVLKRFPTSFSIGFLLGVLVILANQNLILFGTFHGYGFGTPATNKAFANVGLTLFLILTFFSALLFHFKKYIVVAAIDAKGLKGKSGDDDGSYVQYDDSVAA